MSTIIKPAPTPTKTDKTTKIPVPAKTNEVNKVLKDFEEFVESDKYVVILYDDPFNKRVYVAICLLEVFPWTEDMATAVMLQAHNFGFAILGEWTKEQAESYCDKLTKKGLIVEVKASKDVYGSKSG
eukprot:gene6700-9191_t